MSVSGSTQDLCQTHTATAPALVSGFPAMHVSELAEQESWRKEINRPIYHIHKWWATRLGSVFRAITLAALSKPGTDTWQDFYQHHDFTNMVVLDPFMGSGTTLGEALKLGARAIGCDINPISTFLVRQAFTRVPEANLRQAFATLEAEVAPDIRRYYQTQPPPEAHSSGIDPALSDPIPVLYYFWCKTVTTPDGQTLPLFSRYVFAQNAYPKKKPRAQIVCPDCWGIFEGRYDDTDAACPSCNHRFNPQIGPAKGQRVTDPQGNSHKIADLLPPDGSPPRERLYAMLALRDNGEKVYLPAREYDHALYQKAQTRLQAEDLPLPTMAVRPGHNTNQARNYNYHHWRDFFNDRQLLCLGLLLKAIHNLPDPAVREQMLCLFSSTLEFNNRFCSYKGEGTGAVRHMFSNHILKPERTPLENSVWGTPKSSGTFSTLFESRLLKAKRYLDEPFELQLTRNMFGERTGTQKTVASQPLNPPLVSDWSELDQTPRSLMALNGDSASLPIPDGVVDAVITDPPYFDFVHYSELSDFFYAWLSPTLRDRYPWMSKPDSSEPGEVQHKNPQKFAEQLGQVFKECARVLKPEGVLAFSFHHSRSEGWAAIHEAIRYAGLAVVAAHPVHAELRGSSPKNAAKNPISLDAILVCQKQSVLPDPPPPPKKNTPATERAKSIAQEFEQSGYRLSCGDHFVIVASQLLIDHQPTTPTPGNASGPGNLIHHLDHAHDRIIRQADA